MNEILVLKAIAADNGPVLFSVFENDWNLQDRLSLVGKHYGLPMVSVKDAVTEQFYKSKEEGQVIPKKQFFSNIYHPTTAGTASWPTVYAGFSWKPIATPRIKLIVF